MKYGDQWVDLLQSATFAYNTSVHETTGMTPYYSLFGRQAITPGDSLAVSASLNHDQVPTCEYNREIFDNLSAAHSFISAQYGAKSLANLEAQRSAARIPVFEVGDRVYLRDEKADSTVRGNTKTGDLMSGPWTVVATLGIAAYELKYSGAGKKKKNTTANVARLKPYYERDALFSDFKPTKTRSMPEITNGTPEIEARSTPSAKELRRRRRQQKDFSLLPESDEVTTLSGGMPMLTKEQLHRQRQLKREETELQKLKTALRKPPTSALMPHLHSKPVRSGVGAIDSDSDNDDVDPSTIAPPDDDMIGEQVEDENVPMSTPTHLIDSPSASTLDDGPAAAVRHRHANLPTPRYSDDLASRRPEGDTQRRYSQPRRKDNSQKPATLI